MDFGLTKELVKIVLGILGEEDHWISKIFTTRGRRYYRSFWDSLGIGRDYLRLSRNEVEET